MGRYVWSANAERHLRDWKSVQPYRTVDWAEVRHTADDGTQSDGWVCSASDLEPCARGHVRIVIYGCGSTRAAAADACLSRLAEHALEQARKATS